MTSDRIALDGPVVFFTGAGISAESGVPTFRGDDGLWKKFRPEELANVDAFLRNLEEWVEAGVAPPHVDQLRRLRGTDECPEFDGRDREARQMHSPLHDRGDGAWALSLLELASLKHGATAAGPVAHEYRNAGPHSMQVVQRSPDNSTLVTFAPLR